MKPPERHCSNLAPYKEGVSHTYVRTYKKLFFCKRRVRMSFVRFQAKRAVPGAWKSNSIITCADVTRPDLENTVTSSNRTSNNASMQYKSAVFVHVSKFNEVQGIARSQKPLIVSKAAYRIPLYVRWVRTYVHTYVRTYLCRCFICALTGCIDSLMSLIEVELAARHDGDIHGFSKSLPRQ